MKKYGMVFGSAMLLLLSVSPCIRANDARSVRSPEDVPAHLVWNEETGGYYNPEEFEWDPVNRVYKERNVMKAAPIQVEEPESVEEWIRIHEKSDSTVEQALIKFYKESVANQTIEDLVSSQFLTPGTRKALRHLVELGSEHVDEMLEMIEGNSRWSVALVYAVLEIKGLNSPEPQNIDPTPEGLKQWVEKV